MQKSTFSLALMLLCSVAHADSFKLSSSDIQDGKQLGIAQIQHGSGCSGLDISPALHWTGAPPSTQSYAITVYDPDAPTGSGWWHWTLVNIPKNINALPKDAGNRDGSKLPSGAVQGRTDFGSPGFGGACPPHGTHRYSFKVWALDVEKIPIDNNSSGALVGGLLNAHSIGTAELTPISTR
ncbi:YbhB/YbcL family Raf kinase inhibitor-like protein [Pantoea sp. Tr-811]|uniref:YbhB/YbcL family Raf kinase inhibitor-like protein n=1 Tax=Pantoea sp. Tr-811 TaxID=2608361 RepID=UPI001422E236|nr:YbhB/YbcL family Raf kinase inhibitor-like protein [Pantoea sp. Tr-811]NIF24764.1 YbhB/YbcL family Raf kinase inhibitor-like protein [Pantoea sp. Tr-811]